MWFALIIVLWGTEPADTPKMLQPSLYTSEEKCEDAGKATEQAIKDADLDSVAGLSLSCKQLSNPVTESSP